MESARISQWLNLLVCVLLLLKAEGSLVPLILVENAESKGAVCLDGSPPAYHFDKGFGEGINSWIVHIEGGGWCNNIESCLDRKDTRLGSSKQMEDIYFSGILSNEQQFNPDFYNWNRVKVRYCDGSSFTGDVEEVDPTTNLHFRGARIFSAVIEELLAKGLERAENAILSGCSAGGLTTILHCDSFKTFLPSRANVKCVPDAGYFVNVGSAKNLPTSCTSKLSPTLCFFPQYVASHISTPIFVVNSAYDSWQIRYIFVPGSADPSDSWNSCKVNMSNCSPDQLSKLQGFKSEFERALSEVGDSPSKGMFIDSCYAHCQTEPQETWFKTDSPKLANTTIAKAVADWFYGRSSFRHVDCNYPCNPSCQNRVFDLKDLPGI
ncbi:hypothetical protein JHK85_045664 [Glycine max]|nr:hypothetical protein JHK85_045664 [Glycine max]